MTTNYPTTLDDDTSLGTVIDGSSAILAAHHNNLKDGVKALEAKLGIYGTSEPTSIDYRLGHPSSGHDHNGASGHGPKISASSVIYPVANPFDRIITMDKTATMIVGSNVAPPLIMGRTMQLISVQAALQRGPSGATTAIKVLFGASNIYGASVGFGVRFPPGATAFRGSATPNVITYPSGAVITTDVEAVGSSDPGRDLKLTLIFRD
jgi:hypothetical protein